MKSCTDIINSRRSIRKYTDRDVSLSDIEQILEAGRVAPSAKNRQPWRYVVYANGPKREFLEVMKAGLEREENEYASLPESRNGIPDARNTLRIMQTAPVLIVVLNSNASSPFEQVNVDARITEICDTLSIGASIENMILKATELELGTLWIANTCFAYKELTEYLNTSDQLIGAIAVGHPDEDPMPRPRKKLEDIVEYRV